MRTFLADVPSLSSSHPTRPKASLIVAVGLGGFIAGLVLGVFLYAFVFSSYFPTTPGAGINNQVTVSGGAGRLEGIIFFVSDVGNRSELISTSCPITNGEYNVLLLGGRSYSVTISGGGVQTFSLSLYVPTGPSNFRHDF